MTDLGQLKDDRLRCEYQRTRNLLADPRLTKRRRAELEEKFPRLKVELHRCGLEIAGERRRRARRPDPRVSEGLGTKIREVHSAPGGKKIETLVEVVEYEPDRVFGMRITEGIPVHGQINLDASDTGMLFRFRVYFQPSGVMRFAQPIVGAVMKWQFNQHCTNLKAVLESGPAS